MSGACPAFVHRVICFRPLSPATFIYQRFIAKKHHAKEKYLNHHCAADRLNTDNFCDLAI